MSSWPLLMSVAVLCLAWSPIAQSGEPIFLVRHAEAKSGSADPALTERGQQRADDLATQLEDVGLTAIYVTDTMRARATAAPLAKRVALVPTVYDPRALRELAQTLGEAPGPVLVVGHSNTTPALVEFLGGEAGEAIAHDEHDRLYLVENGETQRLIVGAEAPALGSSSVPTQGGDRASER